MGDVFGTEEDVEIGRKLRAALGHSVDYGECFDCGGVGLVPSLSASSEAGLSLWRTCPTCRGCKLGSRA